jgi:hypothetical protein
VTRPVLPATLEGPIALAWETIVGCCSDDDEPDQDYAITIDEKVGFRVVVPSFERGIELSKQVAEALLAVGFPEVSYGSPVGNHEQPECTCYFHVTVGAP